MLKKAAAVLLFLGLSLTACTGIPNIAIGIGSDRPDDKKTTDIEIPEAIPSGETTEAETESEYVPLPEFCDSEDLTAWFDRIQNETPAKMTYVYYTVDGGTSVEYTDPDVISSIAEGLRTLPIGPEAGFCQTDSDFQYTFESDDGSTISFTFCSGTNFYWKGTEYEVDWKDFPELPLYREPEIFEPVIPEEEPDMETGPDEVKPDNLLPEFCNSEALDAWFEECEKVLPEQLILTTDSWHEVDDPDTIRKVLEALKTVRIGGVSDAHVGGSGRRIYDFMDPDNGSISFMFFQDTFDWGMESYDVLDWGTLKDLDPELIDPFGDDD